MDQILSPAVESFVESVGASSDRLLEELTDLADATGIPTVGPSVGRFLRLYTRSMGAERVLELGSGTGYSAYWFAQAVGCEGTVVLTEYDEDHLSSARAVFENTPYESRLRYEAGDGLETVARLDGPFDVVLIDNQEDRYLEAFETVRDRLSPGGALIADNAMTAGIIDFDQLRELVAGSSVPEASEATRGVAAYLESVAADRSFETMVLPLGRGGGEPI